MTQHFTHIMRLIKDGEKLNDTLTAFDVVCVSVFVCVRPPCVVVVVVPG